MFIFIALDKRGIQINISYFSTKMYVVDIHWNCGVVGCGEGVVYLTSPRRPTDTSLQLGKACYPCSR